MLRDFDVKLIIFLTQCYEEAADKETYSTLSGLTDIMRRSMVKLAVLTSLQ